MNRLKSFSEIIHFLLLSLTFLLVLSCSSATNPVVVVNSTHEHLNDHHESNDVQTKNHVHKHRHSENEEEHSHQHLSLLSFTDFVIQTTASLHFFPAELQPTVNFGYHLKSYYSYILDILKPPIRL